MNENAPALSTIADADILAGRILPGIKALRAHLGCSLQEAFLTFYARYEALQLEQPDAFDKTPSEYWEGFYS
ncbi:hypothetical protein AB0469_13375 [Streptomyces sp. NPDC093801]|uniref:hypothetical protein n=1 Tax=Streptomyces sp. NPDC093801 TaxID=3155203 RepID=UPI00344D3081